jgi:hypothetical protein
VCCPLRSRCIVFAIQFNHDPKTGRPMPENVGRPVFLKEVPTWILSGAPTASQKTTSNPWTSNAQAGHLSASSAENAATWSSRMTRNLHVNVPSVAPRDFPVGSTPAALRERANGPPKRDGAIVGALFETDEFRAVRSEESERIRFALGALGALRLPRSRESDRS